MKRRDFLVGAACFSIGCTATRPRICGKGRRLRLALVGCGGRGVNIAMTDMVKEQIHATPWLQHTTPWLAVLYLAIFASVVAFILFCYTVRKIGVTRANVFNNVRPIFTALLMWILFDEILPIWKVVGIIIIIIGLFISQKTQKI